MLFKKLQLICLCLAVCSDSECLFGQVGLVSENYACHSPQQLRKTFLKGTNQPTKKAATAL